MDPLRLLRMAKWARRPASWSRVRLVLVVLALCLAIAGAEYLWGWPEWLSVNGKAKLR